MDSTDKKILVAGFVLVLVMFTIIGLNTKASSSPYSQECVEWFKGGIDFHRYLMDTYINWQDTFFKAQDPKQRIDADITYNSHDDKVYIAYKLYNQTGSFDIKNITLTDSDCTKYVLVVRKGGA